MGGGGHRGVGGCTEVWWHRGVGAQRGGVEYEEALPKGIWEGGKNAGLEFEVFRGIVGKWRWFEGSGNGYWDE